MIVIWIEIGFFDFVCIDVGGCVVLNGVGQGVDCIGGKIYGFVDFMDCVVGLIIDDGSGDVGLLFCIFVINVLDYFFVVFVFKIYIDVRGFFMF